MSQKVKLGVTHGRGYMARNRKIVGLVALGLIALVVATTAIASGSLSFLSKQSYRTAASPSHVQMADLTGDGKLDLITENAGSSDSVSVLAGNGSGSFSSHTDFSAGGDPAAFVLANVVGSSSNDAVVADDDGSVTILPGTGTSTVFDTSGTVTLSAAAGVLPFSVATGDFDADGDQDIVTGNCHTATAMSVWVNNGGGSFTRTDYSYGSGTSECWTVTVANLTTGSDPDIALRALSQHKLKVAKGSGAAAATFPATLVAADEISDANSSSSTPSAPAIALDVDADSDVDLVTSNGSSIRVFKNTQVWGGASVGLTSSDVSTGGSSSYGTLTSGDMDSDGLSDIVVSDSSGVSIMAANGSGSFNTGQYFSLGSKSPAVGDLNGDGKLDLAAISSSSGYVGVRLNGIPKSDGYTDPSCCHDYGSNTVNTSAPVASSAPVISGTVAVGGTLSASSGTWQNSDGATYSYQWLRCDENGNNCVEISGATSSTYTPTADDAGHTLRVRITATNAYGSATSTSSATSLIPATQSTTATTAAVAPKSKINKLKKSYKRKKFKKVSGTATGTAISQVRVALVRVSSKKLAQSSAKIAKAASKSCFWLTSKGKFKKSKAAKISSKSKKRGCKVAHAKFVKKVTASFAGTDKVKWSWSVSKKLRKRLKKGNYVIYSQARTASAKESSFSTSKANIRKFRIK